MSPGLPHTALHGPHSAERTPQCQCHGPDQLVHRCPREFGFVSAEAGTGTGGGHYWPVLNAGRWRWDGGLTDGQRG